MLCIRYYPGGDSGDVLALEEFWPDTLNVSVRMIRGWEPLRELKRRYEGINYRIFFCIRKDELWLLSNYEKESDDTPRNELEKAYKRMQDVLEGRV